MIKMTAEFKPAKRERRANKAAASDAEYDLRDQRAAMLALEEERQRLGMFHIDMEMTSGVSANTFLAWRNCSREPTLGNFVAVAQTLGFDVMIIRQKAVRPPVRSIPPSRVNTGRLHSAPNGRKAL